MLGYIAALFLLAAPSPRYDASIVGEMNGESLGGTMTQLLTAPVDRPVQLRIASPGGSAIATMVFIEMAKDLKHDRGLHVVCTGSVMVASAAALLFESPVCDERVLEPATIIMFHAAYLTGGNGSHADTSMLDSLNRALAFMVAKRLGMTPDQYLEWIKGQDRWLAADLAVQLGFADRLAE